MESLSGEKVEKFAKWLYASEREENTLSHLFGSRGMMNDSEHHSARSRAFEYALFMFTKIREEN